jgi:glucans biosynthesis protein
MRFVRLALLSALVLGPAAIIVPRLVGPANESTQPAASGALPAAPAERPEPPPPTAEEAQAARDIRNRELDPEALFDDLTTLARDLAAARYVSDDVLLPEALAELTYEEYRGIEYRAEAALWVGVSPFEVQLFHPGFLYDEPVRIHLVEGAEISEVPFDPSLFSYGEGADRAAAVAAAAADAVPASAPGGGATAVAAGPGYAGFRIHYPLNEPGSKDETAVFLGASYFRLLGPGHAHGLSTRGIAVDAGAETGEEFPVFRSFWLVRPEADARVMTFYALLEGPSLTGAYRFDLEPSDATVVGVEARLFARTDVAKLGVAPLTSMFLYGADGARDFDDYRPQVHDSEGLLMHTSWGEWIWRPLSNRAGLHVTALRDGNPRGFGLVQRTRDFESYLDLEAQYHRRPSEWVEIEGEWGVGGVELLEIPTPSEFNDNVVAYWLPDQPFRAGDERTYRYTLRTFDRRLDAQTLAQVDRSRIGWDALPGQANAAPEDQRRFVIDFEGGELVTLEDSVTAFLVASSGEVTDPVVQPLPSGSGYRATFSLRPAGNEPADLQLFLEVPGRRVSETWSYLWVPEAPEDEAP